MILLLSLGFGLGVLACVAADAHERGRSKPIRVLTVKPFFRDHGWTETTITISPQDSTLPRNK